MAGARCRGEPARSTITLTVCCARCRRLEVFPAAWDGPAAVAEALWSRGWSHDRRGRRVCASPCVQEELPVEVPEQPELPFGR
jgi:hypothetical protein